MATYNVVRAKHATLVATVVDTVNLSAAFSTVRITNRGTLGTVFVRVDGVDPAVGADETFAVKNDFEKEVPIPNTAAVQVRLICSAASPYSVEGVGN